MLCTQHFYIEGRESKDKRKNEERRNIIIEYVRDGKDFRTELIAKDKKEVKYVEYTQI